MKLNILIPIAGTSRFFEDDDKSFPKPLVEIKGLPMIQRTLMSFEGLDDYDKNFIFILKESHARKFYLENTLRLLTANKCQTILQKSDTKGAACSCLLAVESIDNDDPLIISNGDQFLNVPIGSLLKKFQEQKAEAGVLCFDSVHPQWSYAKMGEDGMITELAEKNPISRNAIAGFYYFRHGKSFVAAAKQSILKNHEVNGLFYVAPTLNELILTGQKVVGLKIPNEKYFNFYSWDRIREFERSLEVGLP